MGRHVSGRPGPRRGRARVLVVMVAATVAMPRGAWATTDPPAAVTATVLVGPYGQPVENAHTINGRGQVIASGRTPSGLRGGVVWERGAARYVAPWWALWRTLAQPEDISDRGLVVGGEMRPMAAPPYLHPTAFAWQEGAWATLPPLSTPAIAIRVNARGQMVGVAGPLGGAGPVAWQDGTSLVPPPGLGGGLAGVDLNDAGQAVLSLISVTPSGAAAPRVVLWELGGDVTEVDLDLPPHVSIAGPVAINERGEILATALSASPPGASTVLWAGGAVVDLGPLHAAAPGVRGNSSPLNDLGHVAGQIATGTGDEHAALWRDGEIIDLGTLGGPTSRAVAVNNRDEVVGQSTTATGEQHAFLWRDGHMIDLGAAVDSRAESTATDLNDNGQVLGTVAGAVTQPVVWTVGPP